MKTYMFPGQGSQAKEMGAGLFDRYPELTAQANAVLGYSIKELCLQDPREELGKTQFTQPALYVVNALSYLRKVEEEGTPDFLAGHSLGEFNALMAAGCFDFETGLRMVQRRGELMSRIAGGGMAAIVNAPKEHIAEVLKAKGLNNVYMANFNAPMQTVISGLYDEIVSAEQHFQRQGKIRFYPLATSGAFHSQYMNEAMEQFRDYLKDIPFAAPAIPVVANVTARPYQGNAILDTLASQIAGTVRWSESMQYLMALARQRGETAEFIECGHGDVLTRLAYTIQSQTTETDLAQFAAELPARAPEPSISLHSGSAEEKVSAWKKNYPIGSRMTSTIPGYDVLETRTDALVLFGHRAAVYMQGYKGYFDLDELTPV
ncbi:ACP S-malonyltransferase [Janthinobacterium sp. FT14W]|uniref:ACP S-malonyltransferase n=1 Tax=Janthinobacterium sp. FT14W TaxID=2654253 RepID=UPI0012659E60|nr:ACP S-malonyltransferase [Janthinobacterium sp. FT14W]KAB8061465.1 ACP S-malonyltransferase [Janthinobacterium sp. FT14W]